MRYRTPRTGPYGVAVSEFVRTGDVAGVVSSDPMRIGLVELERLEATLQRYPPGPDLPPARLDDHPSGAWLDGYRYRGYRLPDSAVEVLENADNVVFASVADKRGQAAVARGVLTDGWLGVTALTVDQTRRRGGIGRHLMGELTRWAADRGARAAYLQVAEENDAALRPYHTLGYTRHHHYHYRSAPADPL